MAFFAKNDSGLYLAFQLSLRSVHTLKIYFFFVLVIRRKIDYQNYN